MLSGCATTSVKTVTIDSFCEGKFKVLWLEKRDYNNIDFLRKEKWKTNLIIESSDDIFIKKYNELATEYNKLILAFNASITTTNKLIDYLAMNQREYKFCPNLLK